MSILPFSLPRQMALLKANKDLISAGRQEFGALLNQQVSSGFRFKGLAWRLGGAGEVEDEGRKQRITGADEVMVELLETMRDTGYNAEEGGCESWCRGTILGIPESHC